MSRLHKSVQSNTDKMLLIGSLFNMSSPKMTPLGIAEGDRLIKPTPVGLICTSSLSNRISTHDDYAMGCRLSYLMCDANLMEEYIETLCARIINATRNPVTDEKEIHVTVGGAYVTITTPLTKYRVNVELMTVTKCNGTAWVHQPIEPHINRLIHQLEGVLCQVGLM